MADSAEPAARSLRCDVRRIGDELWFFGEVDETNADDLTARAVAEIRDGTVCLDLSQVRFFGAAGTRMMFAARAAAAAVDGQVRVVCSREVMRTLELCRLTAVDGLRLRPVPRTRDDDGAAGRHGS
jgi:anti-anti-sigma factor